MKHSINTTLPKYLSDICTLYVRFGVLPDTFYCGILVPILKKPNIDPSIAKHYRPVVISTVFSKLMEMAILEDSSEHDFNMLQFGFVSKRGTDTAISLANNIIQYINKRRSPVHTCTLDAKMAFNGIPHSILMHKVINIIPDKCWRILKGWYTDFFVQEKWNQKLSNPIKLEKRTRQ